MSNFSVLRVVVAPGHLGMTPVAAEIAQRDTNARVSAKVVDAMRAARVAMVQCIQSLDIHTATEDQLDAIFAELLLWDESHVNVTFDQFVTAVGEHIILRKWK